jgi:hypothetical protein
MLVWYALRARTHLRARILVSGTCPAAEFAQQIARPKIGDWARCNYTDARRHGGLQTTGTAGMGSKMEFDIRRERRARRTSPVLPLLQLPSAGRHSVFVRSNAEPNFSKV